MVSIADCLGDYIIYIYFHSFSNLLGKNQIHESLVGGSSIFQTKQHYFIIVGCIFCYKCHFLLVHRMHLNLVVARIHIHKSKESCLRGSINQFVNAQ